MKPFYTKESLTPRSRLGPSNTNARGNDKYKKRRRDQKQQYSAKEIASWSLAAKALARTEEGQEKEIYAEITKRTNNKRYLICVYKELEGDVFTIHSLDEETSQQHKLALTSDQVHLIVEEAFPLVDLRSHRVWVAVLEKYKLYDFPAWEAIGLATKSDQPAVASPVPQVSHSTIASKRTYCDL